MYTEYFGLRECPFSIAPDPRYLFMSEKHREALAHLTYGISGDGFILLTGEVGTGKTTVCRCLLEQLPGDTDVAFVLYPKLSVRELFATICQELRIEYPRANASNKDLLDAINAYLLDAHARGRKTVLIIEEAQNLDMKLLEQVRLLTNLETDSRKLLQIIMVGQPELRDILARADMKQVAQRITARYHLGPLSRDEVSAYVSHRLRVAGGSAELFPPSVVGRIFRLSGGIPRLINLLCDRSLLGAYAHGNRTVDVSTVVRAWQEISGSRPERSHPRRGLRLLVAVMLFLVCGAVVAALYYVNMAQSDVGVREVRVHQTHAPPATLEWPADQPIEESQDMAYRSLFGQWGASYEGGGEEACRGTVSPGLQCLRDSGNLNTLARLNRPAVLTLFDSRGRKYYATLTALRGGRAAVTVGSVTRNVDIHRLERLWFGDFTMLWRAPSDYRGDIRPGDRGAQVMWLGRRLSRGQETGTDYSRDLVYNNEMIEQVKKFQLANGLTPDGIVGPRTMILMNAGDGGPTLSGREGA